MPEKFRKWAPWVVAFLLCFSLLVNVHCLILVLRYREIYQAPPVWATESGAYVVAEPSDLVTDAPESEGIAVSADSDNRTAEEVDSENPEEPVSQEPIDKAGMTVYLTKSGTKFHREGCSSLSKSKIPISYEDAVGRGFEPCGRCKP